MWASARQHSNDCVLWPNRTTAYMGMNQDKTPKAQIVSGRVLEKGSPWKVIHIVRECKRIPGKGDIGSYWDRNWKWAYWTSRCSARFKGKSKEARNCPTLESFGALSWHVQLTRFRNLTCLLAGLPPVCFTFVECPSLFSPPPLPPQRQRASIWPR